MAQLSEVTGQTKPLCRMCFWPGSPVPHWAQRRPAVPASPAPLTGAQRRPAVPASLAPLAAVFARPSLAGGSAGQTAAPPQRVLIAWLQRAFCALVSSFTMGFKNDDEKILRNQKSVLYICVFFPVLHKGLSLPSFKIPYICVSILYWCLSFWLHSV